MGCIIEYMAFQSMAFRPLLGLVPAHVRTNAVWVKMKAYFVCLNVAFIFAKMFLRIMVVVS